MKTLIIIIVILVIITILGFLYATRPVKTNPDNQNLTTSSTTIDKVAGNDYYKINNQNSLLNFKINEVLNGKPNLVVGTSSKISGIIIYNQENQTLSLNNNRLAINAQSFVTDNDRRNSAIIRFILKSDQAENQNIIFTLNSPINLNGLENNKTINVPGDLTISNITKPISIPVTINRTDKQIIIDFETKILRSDYKLVIPNIPFVASVPDEFTISGKIIANLDK